MSVIGTTRGGKIYTDTSLSSGGADKTIQDKLKAGGWYHISSPKCSYDSVLYSRPSNPCVHIH